MKKIAIYTRKSRLTDTGDSIGTQIKLVKDYFRNKECEFEVFEDEGFSGGNINRPAFKLMMEKVKKNEFSTIAVYKIDRIARNIIDFFKIFDILQKENTSLVSISEGFDASTPMGMMIMTMLAGFAEMERMNIKQRVTDNMIELAKKGKWTGGNCPLGYEAIRVQENGKECSYLKIKEDEKEIVKEIYDLFVEGYSTRKISKIINDEYSLNTSPTRISYILYSPIYVGSSELINKYLELNNYEVYGTTNGKGFLTYQKTTQKTGTKHLDKENKTIVAASKHEPIISGEIWIKAQERLKQITINPRPRTSKYTFLAKMVTCSYCGENMNVHCEIKRKGGYYRFFKKTCNCNHGIKNGSRLSIERGETLVLKLIKEISNRGIKEFLSDVKEAPQKDESKKIEREINKIDKNINGLTDKLALANENIIEVLMNRINDMINKKKDLQEQLLIIEQRKKINSRKDDSTDLLDKTIKNFVKKFDKMTMEEKQLEIRKIFECFTWDGLNQELNYKFISL